MSPLIKISAAALSGLAATVALGVPANAAALHHGASHRGIGASAASHLVFVQDDSTSGNHVHVYVRSADGGLTAAGSYGTGGKGGVLAGSVVDHLASEGSLTYDSAHHLLYAVNAGSDSITVFGVHGDRLVRHQVISSGGRFPVSITEHAGRVFVLNARGGGSVSGFVRVGGFLVRVPSWHRTLGLNPDQTPEFTSTPGQIGFAPDGRQLVVTTKNGADSVAVFGFRGDALAATPTITSLAGAVPFGFAFDAAGHLVLTEAGTNTVATFAIAPVGALAGLDSAATGQAATCWVVAVNGVAYASNAGSASLSSYRVGRRGELTSLGNTTTDAGTVDATASSDGRFLYVEGGAAGTVDSFRIARDGSLASTGSVTVPHAAGAEGIAAS